MSVGLVRSWLRSGALDLPLPGSGATAERWQRLAALAESDVTAGRLAEAHADAVAILAELDGPPVRSDQWWGVWAAESRDAVLSASDEDGLVVLDGTKTWCSGAGLCSHALTTARLPSGERALFAVDLSERGVRALPSNWRNAGMAESDTRAVQFTSTPARRVGRPGDYLARAGFWHGAAGIASCWLGGARAVAAPLYRRAVRTDAHALAHLGAVDAALAGAEAVLMSVAADIDADPLNRKGRAELLARRARSVVESAVDEAIARTARALGPEPLSMDAVHAARVADLSIYVRQSHAERDLERLGVLAGEGS